MLWEIIFSVGFQQFFALGIHPTEGARFYSIYPQVLMASETQGVSLSSFNIGRKGLHIAPCELLSEIPCAKPEFPPNTDNLAQTGHLCSLSLSYTRPGFA